VQWPHEPKRGGLSVYLACQLRPSPLGTHVCPKCICVPKSVIFPAPKADMTVNKQRRYTAHTPAHANDPPSEQPLHAQRVAASPPPLFSPRPTWTPRWRTLHSRSPRPSSDVSPGTPSRTPQRRPVDDALHIPSALDVAAVPARASIAPSHLMHVLHCRSQQHPRSQCSHSCSDVLRSLGCAARFSAGPGHCYHRQLQRSSR
jgi:hypothetical protein